MFKDQKKYLGRVGAITAAVATASLASGVAYAVTNWTVGLNANSAANAQGAGITNLTISDATTAPSLSNKLYPGGTGDISFTISNPNPFPVSVTALTTPTETLTTNDAPGFTGPTVPSVSTGGSPISGCGATSSTVTWKTPDGASHNLAGGGFTIGAATGTPTTVVVTLTNDALMDQTAPLACAGTPSSGVYPGVYFVMPALTAVTAYGGTLSSGQPAIAGTTLTTSY